MNRILGLDLGTNSIGWALVNNVENKILGTGVRIFPEGVETKTIGSGEKEQSKNATRREARQTRRQYFRKKLRKAKLLDVLIDHDMCPLDKGKKELKKWTGWDKSKSKGGREFPSNRRFNFWLRLKPYELRAKAVKQPLLSSVFTFTSKDKVVDEEEFSGKEQLGRILYHLIQRRGFLSNRKGKEDGKIFKGKDDIIGIDDTREKIEDKTLGSYLYSILPEKNKPYKKKTDSKRVRARYTLREMYVNEFHQIWEKQASNLGLEHKKVKRKKIRFLKGSLERNRNKKKIKHLNTKYGEENVTFKKVETGYKVTTQAQVAFKEFLGGEIREEDDDLKFKSNDSVLFYQRPLRSQKGLLAKCSLEGKRFYDKKKEKWITIGPTPCPKSHPDFELKRTYEFINTIEYGAKQQLDEHQRKLVLDLINTNDRNFNFKKIPKKLNLTHEQFNYADDFKVTGNYTLKHLKPLFTTEAWNKEYKTIVTEDKKGGGKEEVEKNEYGYERIWHYFYFYDDASKLLQKLREKYGENGVRVKNGLNDKNIEDKILGKLKDGIRKGGITLKEGYSNTSLKAIRNVLPYLNKKDSEGNYYKRNEAVLLGGVKNAFGKRWSNYRPYWDEIENEVIKINRQRGNKEGEAIEKIKSYLAKNNFGFKKNDRSFQKLYHHSQEIEKKELKDKLSEVENLRNPIVQQGLNEMRRLVNDLIEEYGKFDRIIIELGRDLKNGKQKRKELTNRIKENRNKNDEARTRLTENGLRHSRENIHKYLLFKEIEDKVGIGLCPYTGQMINIEDVLGVENTIQTEHIIPQSISLNNSFANKTLCDAKFNGLKGEKTPFQFYQENNNKTLWGAKSWEEVKQRAFRVLPYYKAKKFTAETDFKLDNFIERQLNDTRYMSKKAKKLLSEICEDVRAMPGYLTSELRYLWGANNVLQPIRNIEFPDIKIDKNKAHPYYLVVDENNRQINFQRKYNKKPPTKTNETTLAGKIDKKGMFSSIEKYTPYKEKASDFQEGEYWKILALSEPKKLVKVFRDKPETNEDRIVLRGKIKKEKFKNNSIGSVTAKGIKDGTYWASVPIKNRQFEKPIKGKRPKKKKNQILFYGEVKDTIFTSYIYQCSANLEDGKYWVLLDLNFENVIFEKAIIKKPKIGNQQIIIQGTVNDDGVFSSEIDYDHQFQSNKKGGKYYAVFDIVTNGQRYELIKNKAPKLKGDQKLIEGNIWVDKYTGEIKFDPKKNRDDHRHHAIDAIVIALSEQSYLQRLSTYYANKKKRNRGNRFDRKQMDFPKPWDNFHYSVKKAAEQILVSYKQDRKVLTKVTKKVNKNGKIYKSSGMAVRGKLHDKTFYGRNKHCGEDEYVKREKLSDLKYATTSGKAVYLDDIIDDGVRKAIFNQIRKLLSDDEKKIFDEIKSKEQVLSKTTFKTKKEKKAEEKAIKELKKRITKSVKTILSEQKFYMPNEGKRYKRLGKEDHGLKRKPVPIKKVRVKRVYNNARFLKETHGLHLKKNEANDYNQYVNPENNHHIAIYRTPTGELKMKVVPFWDAVERERQGINAIDKNPKNGYNFVESVQENDLFLVGLTDEEIQDHIDNPAYLKDCLYRVQNISTSGYNIVFRHHTASTLDDPAKMIGISSMRSWETQNPVKVSISPLGELTLADT